MKIESPLTKSLGSFQDKMRILRYLTVLIIVMLTSGERIQADSLENELKNLEDFSTVYNVIKNNYIKEKKSQDLIRSAIAGMVRDLDPYSDVLTARELEMLEYQSVGQFVGIGVLINRNENRYIVTQVFDESPAAGANIQVGDEIVKIDSAVLSEKKEGEIHKLLQGEVGTELEVEFIHHGETITSHKSKLKRALVKANSVECFSRTDSIAVLTVHQFLKHTAKELTDCIQQSSYQALILDLRNNPGGLLISAVEVAELFVDIGDIVQIKDRNNKIIEHYIARDSKPDRKPFLAVLINGFSASAAEIVAGAIRDRGSGFLIGERSFGKGVVQSVYPIGKDLFIKITTAQYFTPSKIGFDGVGIEPDIKIHDSIKVKRYGRNDKIFQKALELTEAELANQD